jgi:DNA mismatch repair ATPase MutL
MSVKELAIQTMQELPEDASWQEVEERIHFMMEIEKARQQVKDGDVVSHSEVKSSLEQWITA